MTSRPFHHGNLRAVLLEQAERMLHENGVDGLSLRELAREAGVSHGAPRSHFIDRRALLDALAERGFQRLTERVAAAIAAPGSFEERFRLVSRAYVDFGVDEAALMELMFAAKSDHPSPALQAAAARLFEVLDAAIPAAPAAPSPPNADPSAVVPPGPATLAPALTAVAPTDADTTPAELRTRFKLLFAATMQGTATLITSRRITRSQGDAIIADAAATLLTSPLAARLGLPQAARAVD